MSDIQADSRVPSLPDLRFRLSLPSVVAERIPVVRNRLEPRFVCADGCRLITKALKGTWDKRHHPDAGESCRLWADHGQPCAVRELALPPGGDSGRMVGDSEVEPLADESQLTLYGITAGEATMRWHPQGMILPA